MRFIRILFLAAVIAAVISPTAGAGGYTDASYFTPVGMVGQSYSHVVQWKPGTGCPPYTYSVVGGVFPPGLSLSSDGHITGKPTTPGTYTFYIRQTDNCGIEGEGNAPFVIKVEGSAEPPLAIASSSAPGGEVGLSYAASLAATGGGSASRAWSLAAGALPPGLALSGEGKLAGVPTTSGTYTFSVAVSNGTSSATKSLSITVIPGIAFAAAPVVPQAEVRTPYSATVPTILGVSGGAPPYSYASVSGFPFGIGFDASTGTIFGSPREAGTLHLTVAVSDANGARRETTLELVVLPKLRIVSRRLVTGSVGKSYRMSIRVNGGKGPVWALAAGKLPTGLRLNRATGMVQGVPRRTGTFAFSVAVTDALGAKVSTRFTLRISR